MVIDRYGNTSSASIPLALHDAIERRPGPRRGHPAADGVRRRHDLGQRRLPLERVSAGSGGAGPPLVVLAAGRARRYGGCKPLAPVGPPRRGGHRPRGLRRPRRRVRHRRPGARPEHRARPSATTSSTRGPTAVDVRFALQPAPLGTVHAVLAASEFVGDTPYGVCNADDVYGTPGCALLAAHLRGGRRRPTPWWATAWPTPSSVSPPSPVGSAASATDGRLLGVDERRQVTARRPRAGSWPTTVASPDAVARRPGLHEPVGLHPGLPQDPPGGHGRRRRRLRGGRGPPARGGGRVARDQPRSPCSRPRDAASG